MEKLLTDFVTTDFVTVSAGMCHEVTLTASQNGELEIGTINGYNLRDDNGIALPLNKEKVVQLRDFLNQWLENGGFIVPQPIDEE